MLPESFRGRRAAPHRARLACALCAATLVAVAASSTAQHRRDRARIELLEARAALLERSLADRDAARSRAEQQAGPLAWRLADAQYAAGSHEAEARRLREENALLRQTNARLEHSLRAREQRAAAAPPPRSPAQGPVWFYGSNY